MAENFQEWLRVKLCCHQKFCSSEGCIEALDDALLSEFKFDGHLIDYLSTGVMCINISNLMT